MTALFNDALTEAKTLEMEKETQEMKNGRYLGANLRESTALKKITTMRTQERKPIILLTP